MSGNLTPRTNWATFFQQNGENGKNGHGDNPEMSCLDPDMDLSVSNLMDNEKKEELISKLLRHRKILMTNCEQAEDEIRRVDEISHDIINHVLEVSVPGC